MMNDTEQYIPQMLDENQGTCTMYILVFHAKDCITTKAIPRERHEGSMPISTRHCQNYFPKCSSSNRLGREGGCLERGEWGNCQEVPSTHRPLERSFGRPVKSVFMKETESRSRLCWISTPNLRGRNVRFCYSSATFCQESDNFLL